MKSIQEKSGDTLSRWGWLSVVSLLILPLTACQNLPADSLVDASGVTIRQSAIDDVVNDTTLTDAEKRQGLQDLGITDESLIDALIQGASSSS